MKTRKHIILMLITLLSITVGLKAKGKELSGKHILIVYGGWEGHQPQKFAAIVSEKLIKQGASVDLSDSLGIYSDSSLMSRYDLIIQSWTNGKMTKEETVGLTNAVKKGVGFAGCHGGIADSFRENVNYQYMVGGQWIAHPGGSLTYQINVVQKDNPIMLGIKDFKVTTEQYFMHVDPSVNVLATSTFSGEVDSWIEDTVMPVCWTKNYGIGKVFFFSVGHNPEELLDETIWAIFNRGMKWAMK